MRYSTRLFAGTLTVDDDVALLAFCANVVDWMTDRTLDLPVIVGTNPAPVRAAELARPRRGGAEVDLIAEIETEYSQRDGEPRGAGALAG